MSEPVALPTTSGLCPLCRRPNGCAVAAGAAAATPCWCVGARLDAAALARATAADGGSACVCAACARVVTPSAF
jgi:hypothetical protein